MRKVVRYLSRVTKNASEPSETRLKLAAKIRRLRMKRAWSQETLAEHAGLHRNYVGAVERGEQNIGVDSLERIATALGLEAWELLRTL